MRDINLSPHAPATPPISPRPPHLHHIDIMARKGRPRILFGIDLPIPDGFRTNADECRDPKGTPIVTELPIGQYAAQTNPDLLDARVKYRLGAGRVGVCGW